MLDEESAGPRSCWRTRLTTWCTRCRSAPISRGGSACGGTPGRAAARAGVIIYLGGLGDQVGSLSSHLQSGESQIRPARQWHSVIEFRASIVVGAGSLSFQMIEALVERLPVMVCPRWVAMTASSAGGRRRGGVLSAAWNYLTPAVKCSRSAVQTSSRTGTSCRDARSTALQRTAGAAVDAAPVGPLARGDTGAGPCRSRAGGRS